MKLPKSVALFPSDPGTFCGIYGQPLLLQPDFSSDLERAPGARSIAEEKSGVTILVIELHWSQGSEHFRSPAVFLGILPHASNPRPSAGGLEGARCKEELCKKPIPAVRPTPPHRAA